MTIAKGKTPSLISGISGKPVLVTVQKKSNCFRCGAEIQKGLSCFDIPKVGGGFSSSKRCCVACFALILDKSKMDIAELERQLASIQAMSPDVDKALSA